LCYTRGREAQEAGKREEAMMEMQRALQLDPDLGQAKSALEELMHRR
jgi:3-methyladenine DNA glycosylase/8-oxoguanine DNA glycosylase